MQNSLYNLTNDESRKVVSTHENNTNTITTLEIAEMMNMRHDRILRKLEGQDIKGKHIDGVIEILTRHNLGASDYFIPSTYKDESGKENKCYKITKLGCDFLANKFTGEKGIIFTARYVKRFADMEQHIKDQTLKRNINRLAIPPEKNWYKQHTYKLEVIKDYYEVSSKAYFHRILGLVSEKYDLEEARKKFMQLNGYIPDSNMEIVIFFPQLKEYANQIIEFDYSSVYK